MCICQVGLFLSHSDLTTCMDDSEEIGSEMRMRVLESVVMLGEKNYHRQRGSYVCVM